MLPACAQETSCPFSHPVHEAGRESKNRLLSSPFRYSLSRVRGLPQDTEITYCPWCRKFHGIEVFCPTTLHRWLKYGYRSFIALGERWLERFAYSVAILALGCFVIALLIAVAGLLYSVLE
jgi:hypothetical protein